MKLFLLFAGLFVFIQTAKSQTSYTWNGTTSTSWSTATNWTPNGVPGSLDNVTVVTGSNTCKLSAASTINNFTITSGTLDLGASTLTVNGTTGTFTKGTVQNGDLTIAGATTTTFGNGPMTMNCNVYVVSAAVTFKSTTFQDSLVITKTGTTNDASAGLNVFNGVVIMNNAGTGYLMTGNGNADQFNGPATFNNTGGANIYVANNSTNNTFAGVVTFNNSPTTNNGIYVSWNAVGTVFNNNIVVNSSFGAGVQFCGGSTSATATLASGNTITAGTTGFSAGTLLLRQFTQAGATAQNITLTGTGSLNFGPSAIINGNITTASPALILSGCTFNGTSNLTKTGTTGDWGQGGNVYNGVSTITNSGGSFLVMGNTNPDIWNNSVTFTDNGSERVLPAWASAGNQFNGNIYVNTSGSAQGIQFCGGNTTATATQAATYTIQAGATGLTAGYLYLKQFTQLGSAPINLTATGTSVLDLGPGSNFGGTFTATAPDIWAQGATYNSAASFTKTGGSNNHNNQNQNIFNSTCTINQQSNTGYFMLGFNSNDLFNANITVTSTGTGGIYLGWSGGSGAQSPTLSAGNTILVGTAGFSAGFLGLYTFTQLGTAPLALSFTGTSTGLTFARGSVIGGNVTTSTPDVYFSGCTFNGSVNATKTGANNDAGSGGNIFQGADTLTNAGGGFLILGNGAADTWNSTSSFNSTGSSFVGLGWNSVGNTLNGNISFSSTGSSTGVQFDGGSATATTTLSAGYTMQIGGAGFSVGTLLLKQLTEAGSTPINLTLTGTTTTTQVGPSSAIGGSFTVVSPNILLNGAVYSDSVNVTKTGANGQWSNGGNTFNSTLTVNQQGGGYFGFANGTADIYNGDVYTNNNSTERIIFGNNCTGNQFNGNIIMTQIGSSLGTAFGWSASTAETQASGKTMSIGAAGYSVGYLQIERFTQNGTTAVNLPLTGTASLTFGPTSAFGGNVTASSPTLYLNGCTFNGTSNLTKTGTTGDFSQGGNIFNDVCAITNSGSSYLVLGNNNPDIWNSSVTFTDNGSERLLPCWASAGNQFNGNINVNTGGSAQGIQFCGGNTTATATLASGYTVQSGTSGLNAGYLILKQFTQQGSAPINLTLSSTATYLQYGPSSLLGGNVVSSSPGLLFNGCTFNDSATCIKTGASNDGGSGNNIFNGITSITDAGTGYLLLGNGNPDQFNATASFFNTGGNNLYVAYNSSNNIFAGLTTFSNSPSTNNGIYVSSYSVGTVFNSNIVVNSTSGQGVQFCSGNTSATATLAAGNTITVGTAGFSAGALLLRQFTQTGSTAQNLSLTGTGNLTFGPLSAFGGNTTVSSPTLLFNGCTFSGTATGTKTGTTNDGSTGNNIFNGVTTMTNTGTGWFMFGNGNPDQFNATSTFNNTGGNNIYVAYNSTNNVFGGVTTFNNSPSTNNGIYVSWNSTGTVFNNNILVNSTSGAGVQFCGGNTSATATLSSGNTISVGTSGFTAGTLLLRQFTQTGATPQSLTLTGAGNLTFGPSSAFNANVTSSSPTLLYNGCVFNGTVNGTKTGTTNDQSQGNNTFNGTNTFTDNGTGYLMMTLTAPDAYNGNTSFVQSSTGAVYPNYNGNSTYAGNVTVTSPATTAITFGKNGGTATFSGSALQTINATTATPTPVFTNLTINNMGGGVTLNNTSINVSINLTLSSGLLNTSTAYILTMLNGSATSAGTALSTSYVNGPMKYQKSTAGSTTLNFPIGNAPDCRPFILTVNHTNNSLYTYTAQLYNASAAALGYTLPPTVDAVSGVHYYTITRTDVNNVVQPTLNLTGNQTIQIFFGSDDVVTSGAGLTIVKNTYLAPTAWINIGGTGAPTGNGSTNLTGSVTSTSSPTAFNSFSTFAIADNLGGGNVLPVELLYFQAVPDKTQVDLSWAVSQGSNEGYFTVLKSKDGISFEPLVNVDAETNSNSGGSSNYATVDPNPYSGVSYYRLKQTNVDSSTTYSGIVSVDFQGSQQILVYPNPVTNGTVYVSGLPSNQSTLAVSWFDETGRQLLQQNVAVQAGLTTLNVPFRTGVYFLRFVTEDGTVKVQKVMVFR